MRTFKDIKELKTYTGLELGVSDWVTIDQTMISQYARITGDDQWIHTDVERAKKGPFGSTIAHGYLILSFVSRFCMENYCIESVKMGINYGLDCVRFITPVPAGSRIRGIIRLKNVEEQKKRLHKIILEVEIQLEGAQKPACVAEVIGLLHD